MYRLINVHIEKVLNANHFERDVRRYVQLMEQFPKVNVTADHDFRLIFRRYWAMNAAHLSPQFIASYFDLLQSLKSNSEVGVEAVARKLYEIPTGVPSTANPERHTLQFSFSTKLVHMLRPHEPVYDSNVRAFFFLPDGSTQSSVDEKLYRLLPAYEFLRDEYRRVIQKGLLSVAITAFQNQYDQNNVYTQEKIVDTLIWQFVTLLQAGVVRDRQVTYS